MSLRAASRLSGCSFNTVTRLLVEAGKACQAYHDEHVREPTCKRVQCDEIWSFIYSKAKNVAKAKVAPEGAGDTWTWTAIDADSKLAVSWLVGGRDAEYANVFMQDVADRLANRIQLTTDGLKTYLEAVEGAFGNEIDYAQLIKVYGAASDGEKRYSPAKCIGAQQASSRWTARQGARQYVLRRAPEPHDADAYETLHAVDECVFEEGREPRSRCALHFMFYNFVRIHKTLECSPAMAAGVTDRLWELEDIVALIDAAAPKLGKRGPYKERISN